MFTYEGSSVVNFVALTGFLEVDQGLTRSRTLAVCIFLFAERVIFRVEPPKYLCCSVLIRLNMCIRAICIALSDIKTINQGQIFTPWTFNT